MYAVSFSCYVKPYQTKLELFESYDEVKKFISLYIDRMYHVMRYEFGEAADGYTAQMRSELGIGVSMCGYPAPIHCEKRNDNTIKILSIYKLIKQPGQPDAYNKSDSGKMFEFVVRHKQKKMKVAEYSIGDKKIVETYQNADYS